MPKDNRRLVTILTQVVISVMIRLKITKSRTAKEPDFFFYIANPVQRKVVIFFVFDFVNPVQRKLCFPCLIKHSKVLIVGVYVKLFEEIR